MTKCDEVLGSVVVLQVIDVVNRESAIGFRVMKSADSANMAITLSNLFFEFLCKLMRVDRTCRIGKTAGSSRTGNRAKPASVHAAVDVGCGQGKGLPALLTDRCRFLPCLGSEATFQRTIPASTACYFARLAEEIFAAMVANKLDFLVLPIAIALTGTKDMLKSLGVRWRTMDRLPTLLTRFIPSSIGTFAGTKTTAAGSNLIALCKELLATRLTDASNLLRGVYAKTLGGAELSLCGGGCLKRLAALLAVVKHKISPVRDVSCVFKSGALATGCQLVGN